MTSAPVARCGLCDIPFATPLDIVTLPNVDDAVIESFEGYERLALVGRLVAHKFCIGFSLAHFAANANTFERDELVRARARLVQKEREATV